MNRIAPLPTSSLSAFHLFADLINCVSVQRLSRIRFLGGIEFFAEKIGDDNRSAGSRLDHTLNTAELALAAATAAKVPHQQTLIVVIHALLHDVGHGPLSHSSEEFFKQQYGLDHHRRFLELLSNDTADVVQVLRQHKVLDSYRNFISSPSRYPTSLSFFYGPLNVDTIEGITRAARYFDLKFNVKAAEMIQFIAKPKVRHMAVADNFWALKEKVYSDCINTPKCIYLDRLVTRIFKQAGSRVSKEDFQLTDDQFEEKYADVISQTVQNGSLDTLQKRAMRLQSRKRQRVFKIDRTVVPRGYAQFAKRYSQYRV